MWRSARAQCRPAWKSATLSASSAWKTKKRSAVVKPQRHALPHGIRHTRHTHTHTYTHTDVINAPRPSTFNAIDPQRQTHCASTTEPHAPDPFTTILSTHLPNAALPLFHSTQHQCRSWNRPFLSKSLFPPTSDPQPSPSLVPLPTLTSPPTSRHGHWRRAPSPPPPLALPLSILAADLCSPWRDCFPRRRASAQTPASPSRSLTPP